MSIRWGSHNTSGTNNQGRVGIDVSASSTSTTTTFTVRTYFGTRYSSFGSLNYSLGGAQSGSGSTTHSHTATLSSLPTSASSPNVTLIATRTVSVSRQYGSSQSRTFTASVSGVPVIPGTMSASASGTVPARSIEAPNAPSNVGASRISDTRTRISWSRNPTTARPWSAVHVERRHVQGDGSWAPWIRRASSGLGLATSFTDSTVANRRFQYRVRSSNTAGVSSWMSTGTIDTTPAAPSSVRARESSAGIHLTWTNEARVPTRVRIEHQADGGAWEDLGSLSDANESWTYSDPDIGASHRFRLRHEGQSTPGLNSGWAYSNVIGLAAPPAAPMNLGPSSPWDATEDRVLAWRHVPTDSSGQERFQVRHRLLGGAWTTVPEQASEQSRWTLPAGTYANGDVVQWQVRTWGVHPDPSEWSGTGVQEPHARPTAAINTPESGVVHDMASMVIEWGFEQEQGLPQSAFRWELVESGQVVQDGSGSGPVTSRTLHELMDAATYTLRLRVQSGGLWGEWDESTFSVSYLPPQAPSVQVSWDVGLGAAVIDIAQPPWDAEYAEPDYHHVWRAIGDGRWVMIADRVPIGSSVTDPIPVIGEGTVNHYRATTVSTIPSAAHSEHVSLAVSVRDTRGWVYLNGGAGMSQVCRVKANASRDDSEGIDGTVEHQAGRRKGVIQSGDVELLDWSVSARIAPDHEGASTRAELVELQKGQAGGSPICYRDPLGHGRWFGFMGRPSFSHRTILGEVSWSMVEAEFNEGLAFAAADEDAS